MLKFLALLITVAPFATLAADTNLTNRHYVQQQNIVFKEAHGVGLLLDIFKPTKNPNGRGIVVAASGAWYSSRGKINDLNSAGLFEELCQRGFYVFAVRPGSISQFSAEDMKAHLEEGVRWVKSEASNCKIDPAKLGMFGASAGGHLASLVAVTNEASASMTDASVAAVGVFFPPTDFLDFGGKALDPRKTGALNQSLANLAFKNGVEDFDESKIRSIAKSISPAHLVTAKAPPFLLIHGDTDPLVPLQQSRTMLQALNKAGVRAQLIIKEGGAHPWPTIREEVVLMADWFEEQLLP